MRNNICLRSFQNYGNIQTSNIPTTYRNKNFNKDMDLVVADFYWSCSRKSYLPCGQSYDINSLDAIRQCIKAGARMINLDIYKSDTSDEPVIRNQTIMPYVGKPLSADDVFKLIKEIGWLNRPNYPLILYLTINTNNKNTLELLTGYYKKYFLDKLIDKKYSFNGRNGLYPFTRLPIKDFTGKIALITDKYPIIGNLNEFVNSVISDNQQFINKFNYTSNLEDYGGIKAHRSDFNNILEYNKKNATLVYPTCETRLANMYNPKIDITNPEPEECWNLGCQFVLMNFQYFDDNMDKYYQKFRSGGLVLKPENLRYIPVPTEPIKQQNKNNYFKPRKIEQKGWYSVNF